ncbi:V8-like Glu-specific endopeptidase [Cereibacter ovatus]|uniref:V8-like Glu-specific endopeptidase n=1 Tax=Cereibacter ovatus TaxID=439529 RepID=A0A285CVS2_9RHOB|nr:trypsin-like peptidase domain-containing protein [Cereibacter ovatus]SNX71033.1 V8-like Glu-specific endopeptidase [Cereibacter ovatus]
MRLIAILSVVVGLGLPVQADESRLRSLETGDAGRGWDAVGKLMLGDRGFCTGTLIRPDVVLTAGHCLFDKETGARIDAGVIEFLAGWRNGRAVAYRHVRRAVVHPDYVFSAEDPAERVAHDVAVLELDQPIRLPSVAPFRIEAAPLGGGQVGVVSYAQGRSEAPSLQEICSVLGRMPGTLVLSCSVDFGASGAPVFTMQDGAPSVVSVVSAKAEMDGKPISLASDIGTPLRDILAELDAGGGQLRRAETGVRVIAGGGGGAKFLRPGAP